MDFKKMKPVFITLTYGAEYPSPDVAKQHLRAFLKRIRRFSASDGRNGGFIWRLEFQERGAPHFHIICTNLVFIPKERIQEMWGEIIGYESPFSRIEMIRSKKGVMSYVSKYLAKTTQSGDSSSCGFIYVPYSAMPDHILPDEGEEYKIGRFWGVEDGALISYCEAAWITVPNGQRLLTALKRMASAEWAGINVYDDNGFTLFTPNAIEWFNRISGLIMLEGIL
jgi:hypothetical protein